ncbi:hypothetical protein BUE80_DR001336 [Diplocarpon rosae]|nr:hypothetical protein BUE80_DR001336 [Diplocarpon rosae]
MHSVIQISAIHGLADNIAFFNAEDGKFQSTIHVEDMTFTKAQPPLNAGLSFAAFEELVRSNPKLAQEFREVHGDIELADTLFASQNEILPRRLRFSDTAFCIFILMASRRLESDCFIAGQWDAETYTKEGFHWVQYNCMTN